ncbi:MAG: 2,3-bisphosphoglycerate-independent phosphoglycerate mutase [Deltaproteobacteria bacterium]|nr:2,3-bisphosphoglycerate-independent phosphoglycerate mutase [Deltaproteobacteria bacterium]
MRNVLLLILDGLGLGENNQTNAFFVSNSTTLKSLLANGKYARLKTYGRFVGLPDDQMGNSEVGHMNLGAGRIVKQQQVLLDDQINDFSLFNPLQNFKQLEVVSLVSSGGIHAHIRHLKQLDKFCKLNSISANLHVIADGRDTPPRYLEFDLQMLSCEHLKPVSLIGRFYAMDRDKRWERTKLAYDLLVNGQGKRVESIYDAIRDFYNTSDKSDEFFDPYILGEFRGITSGPVLFMNFREDRMRQLVSALCEESGIPFERGTIVKPALSLVEYDKTFKLVRPLFRFEPLGDTLGEVISSNGLSQLRIAETEKYPHVTYFFSGGREEPFQHEDRVLIPSPREVRTYDLKPEMSVFEVTSELNKRISERKYSLIVANFANCDMVGHTGNFEAAVRACEAVDLCVREVLKLACQSSYWTVLTSDHGNCEQMFDLVLNQAHTAHTKNDVFCFVISADGTCQDIKNEGLLASIAPTILNIMELQVPQIMSGESLLL